MLATFSKSLIESLSSNIVWSFGTDDNRSGQFESSVEQEKTWPIEETENKLRHFFIFLKSLIMYMRNPIGFARNKTHFLNTLIKD